MKDFHLGILGYFKEFWPMPPVLVDRIREMARKEKFGSTAVVVGTRKELSFFGAFAVFQLLKMGKMSNGFQHIQARNLTDKRFKNFTDDELAWVPHPSNTKGIKTLIMSYWSAGVMNKELPNVVNEYLSTRCDQKDLRSYFLTEVDFPETRKFVEETEVGQITLHYLSKPVETEKIKFRRDKDL